MNRSPPGGADTPAREWNRTAWDAHQRVTQLWRVGLRARNNASTIRSTTAETLGRERERMHQYWIDAEIAATDRSIERLVVPGWAGSPEPAVLDPYFLAATDPRLLIAQLSDVALNHSSADRITVSVTDWDGLVIAAVQVPEPAQVLYAPESVLIDGSGVAVLRAIPLTASTGRVLGVFSCWYDGPGPGIEADRPLLDVLAGAAGRLLQWHGERAEVRGSGRLAG